MNDDAISNTMGMLNLSSEELDKLPKAVKAHLLKENAAPELLEALESTYTKLQAAWARQHYEEIGDAMHIVRAAIAKAKVDL